MSVKKETVFENIEMQQKYMQLLKKVESAKREGKIYRFVNCYFRKIHDELRKRGFIEKRKFELNSIYYQMPLTILLTQYKSNSTCEQALMSRLIGNTAPYFIWTWNPRLYNKFKNATFLSKIKIKHADFGFKNGLCRCINRINWLYHEQQISINCPRSYNLIENEELDEYLADYKLTLAISIVLSLNDRGNLSNCFSKTTGVLYYGSLQLALDIIQFFAKKEEGMTNKFDIEVSDDKLIKLEKMQKGVVNCRQKILAGTERAENLIEGIKFAVQDIKRYWPKRIKIDGYQNIWLLKPAFSGCGKGIILSNNIQEILSHVKGKNKQYIVQKYIERPLLIHGVKFDIRHYYLITIDNKYLRSWSHKLCTIKFASYEFTLSNFNKAVHITNTAVQRKVKNVPYHNNLLPTNHMWSIDDLIKYFNETGREGIWDNEIYPVIKKSLVAITMASVHNIDLKPGRFELFGCDTIITDTYQPYLLEINRAPAMCYYTPISQYVCGTVMEDLLKVVLDFRNDPSASTGGFEEIYKIRLYGTEKQ